MKNPLFILSAVTLLAAPSFPAFAHGNHDDHSQIEALDISADEAIATLETGLPALAEKIDAENTEGVIADALSLMAVIKTLQAEDLSERKAAALRQLDRQIDAAKHAAEDGEFDKAKAAATRAESALKLYRAMQ